MKKTICMLIAAACFAVAGLNLTFNGELNVKNDVTALAEQTRSVNEIVGVTTVSGYYEFNSEVSCLEDGANRIKELGCRIIKLWLASSTNASGYPYNTDWSKYNVVTAVDLLKTEYFKRVLDMDFSTYVFELHSFNNNEDYAEVDWSDGMTSAEKKRVSNEVYEVAKYLMQEYNGTGKTFVLQNWEGDNMLGTNYIRMSPDGLYYDTRLGETASTANAVTDESVRTSLRGMIDWFNVRQDGVDRAREEFGASSDVKIRHALEINFTNIHGESSAHPLPDCPILINTVVPYTDCDLYSYSNWQAVDLQSFDSVYMRLAKMQELIGDTYIDIYDGSKVKARRPFDREGQTTRIMLGEFGCPERQQTPYGSVANKLSETTDLLHGLNIQSQIQAGLEFGLEYMLVWQLYCNEPFQGVNINIYNGERATSNDQMRGFWLIRPDGSITSAYKWIYALLNESNRLVDQKAEVGREYSVDGTAGKVYLTFNSRSAVRPDNLNKTPYGKAVTVSASKDGKKYESVEMYSAHSVLKETGEGYEYTVNFLSTSDISGYKYFKIDKIDGELTDGHIWVSQKTQDNIMGDIEQEKPAKKGCRSFAGVLGGASSAVILALAAVALLLKK